MGTWWWEQAEPKTPDLDDLGISAFSLHLLHNQAPPAQTVGQFALHLNLRDTKVHGETTHT